MDWTGAHKLKWNKEDTERQISILFFSYGDGNKVDVNVKWWLLEAEKCWGRGERSWITIIKTKREGINPSRFVRVHNTQGHTSWKTWRDELAPRLQT
jgi:hypothetical protein